MSNVVYVNFNKVKENKQIELLYFNECVYDYEALEAMEQLKDLGLDGLLDNYFNMCTQNNGD